MMKFFVEKYFFIALFFLIYTAPLFPQQSRPAVVPAPAASTAPEESAEGASDEPSIDFSGVSLIDLIAAAKGGGLLWRPDWPVSIPPDLFIAAGNIAALTVTIEPPPQPASASTQASPVQGQAGSTAPSVSARAASVQNTSVAAAPAQNAAAAAAPTQGAEPQIISVEWRGGRLVSFPFWTGSAFVQGRAEYGAQGGLARISLWDAKPAASTGGGAGLEAETLQYDEENRPVLVRLHAGGDSGDAWYFSLLEYGSAGISETRYDENGEPVSVVQSLNSGEIITLRCSQSGETSQTSLTSQSDQPDVQRFFFDANGLVSGIVSGGKAFSAAYERRGLPRYLERQFPPAAPPPATAPPSDAPVPLETERYSFQWDESGRLVRLSGVSAGESADFRYEYTLDGEGNWTGRREIQMQDPQNQGGRLFPLPGAEIRRRVTYTPANGGTKP